MLRTTTFTWNGREHTVLYFLLGTEVYFTRRGGGPTSINAQDEIVEAIGRHLSLDWHEVSYFDVMSHHGYIMRNADFYNVDRLVLAAAQPRVIDRIAVAMSRDEADALGIDRSSLPGVPEEVAAVFALPIE